VNTNVDLGLEIGVIARPLILHCIHPSFDFQTELLSESTILAAMFFIIFNCLPFGQTE
jgi:hypothetical protein